MDDSGRPDDQPATRSRGRSIAVLALAALVCLGASVAYLEQNAPGVLPQLPAQIGAAAGASPPAAPLVSPTPPVLPGNLPAAPADQPLVLLQEDRTGIDFAAGWDGRLYSTRSPSGILCGGFHTCIQSPDGSKLLIDEGGLWVFDRSTTTRTPLGSSGLSLWADDNRHLCLMAQIPDSTGSGFGTTQLVLADAANGSLRPVAGYGIWVFNGIAGPAVLACSVSLDVAGLWARTKAVNEVRFIRLSTGETVNNFALAPDEYPVVSPDGSVIVLDNLALGTAQAFAAVGSSPISPVLPGRVVSLSWDGAWALATTVNGLEVVDMTTGRTLWQAIPGSTYTGAVIPEPSGGGDRMAILIGTCAGCPRELLIVGPADITRRVASGVSLDAAGQGP